MMKTLSAVMILCLAVPSLGAPLSLGWWPEGAPGSTHAVWEFTSEFVTEIPNDGYSAKPEDVDSPNPLSVVATIAPGSTYDGVGAFVSSTYISVNLEVPNFLDPRLFKEIWVDLGDNVINPLDLSVAPIPTNVDWQIDILPGNDVAEFGIRIWPNPEAEKIGFMLFAPAGGVARLDYIHIDTICVPEPATLLVLGLGGLLLRKRFA